MAMAHVAPMNNYEQGYGITDHAVERLRDRLQERDTKYRDDDDLRNLIDSMAKEAVTLGRVEGIMDDGQPAAIVDVGECTMGQGLCLLVKTSHHAGRTPFTIITVLTAGQREANRKSGRWGQCSVVSEQLLAGTGASYKPQPSKSFATKLGDQIGAQLAAVPPKPVPTAPVETRLVTYLTPDGREVSEEYVRAEAPDRIGLLVKEGKATPSTIRVWRQVSASVRVALDE